MLIKTEPELNSNVISIELFKSKLNFTCATVAASNELYSDMTAFQIVYEDTMPVIFKVHKNQEASNTISIEGVLSEIITFLDYTELFSVQTCTTLSAGLIETEKKHIINQPDVQKNILTSSGSGLFSSENKSTVEKQNNELLSISIDSGK